MNTVKIESWGSWKIAWVQDSKPENAIAIFKKGEVDGLGISPGKGFSGKDITFLKEVAAEKIGLIFPFAGEYDLTFLNDFEKLRYLTITNANSKQMLDLRRLTSLEDLVLEWHAGYYLPNTNASLKRLFLRYYKDKKDNLDGLPTYPSLRILELVQGNLASLEGVERFISLVKGNFAYMTKLESVKNLARTPVESLKFEACKKIKDLTSLSMCPCLKELVLFKFADLNSLDFLKLFSKLEEFRFINTKVKDGNMQPLLKLKRVAFINNRSYSHTEDEIKKLIGQPIVPWDLTK